MTEKQYRKYLRQLPLLKPSQASSAGSSKKRTSRALVVKERDLQATCTDWLVLKGWRALRTEFCYDAEKRRTVGEAGMPDYLYLRYGTIACCSERGNDTRHLVEAVWIEWKADSPSAKAAVHQKLWHAAERKRGALVLVAGEDFPATFEGFKKWYEEARL